MIALLIALASMQPGVSNNIRGGSVAIPHEAAPHMLPYMNCIVNGINADRRMPTGDLTLLRAIRDDTLTRCKSVRQAVFDDTDRALKNIAAYRDDDHRRAVIEDTLRQMDRMPDALIDPSLVMPNAPNPASQHN